MAIDQIAQSGLSSLKVIYYSAQLFSHRAMREVASRAKWRGRIPDAAFSRVGILSVADYYDLLAPLAAGVDIWQTRYYHVMPSLAAIAEWLRATGLRPFLDPLTPAERDSFLDDYLQSIAPAYPPRADGRVLLAFPRLFIVARRGPAYPAAGFCFRSSSTLIAGWSRR